MRQSGHVSRSTIRRRLAAFVLTMLVGSCSLPTFNPPKIQGRGAPDGAAATVVLVASAAK